MTTQEQARQAVIQALGALTLQGIELQIQIADLQTQMRKATQSKTETIKQGAEQ